MKPHLVRYADRLTKKPVVDEHGRAFYFIECPRCGIVNRRGLSRIAAQAQADVHRCSDDAE